MTFGISGKLYENNVLLYDRQTQSLWSQLKSEAVTGPLTGTKLEKLPFEDTTWKAWKKKHPQTSVLSTETGFKRDYVNDPYSSYYASDKILFPVENESKLLPGKERVLGIEIGEIAKAYPLAKLKDGAALKDRVGNEVITIQWDRASQSARVTGSDGKDIPYIISFWFAWYNFHPETQVSSDREATPSSQ